MGRSTTLALEALRRFVIARQGFAARFRRADAEDVVRCIERLSCVQLDSISIVDRSHRIVIASRAGAPEPDVVTKLLAKGRLFEYWAHEACLIPIGDYPLFRSRMIERRTHHWWGPVIDSDPALAKRIVNTIRERGALGSRDFEGRGGGGMWNLKPAKRMLDALWTAGELVVSGRQGFQRLYDLPERVLPESVRSEPPPEEDEVLMALALRAIRARGALTASGVKEHYRLAGGVARIAPHLKALERKGEIVSREVDDGGAPVWLPSDADIDDIGNLVGGVLLSPFDNLLWDRAWVKRLFGFEHLIEVYKKQHQRAFGYYVLPFLFGERLAGRADLKADRASGVLRVKAFHLEPGVRRSGRLEEALDAALLRLARGIGLSTVDRSP